MYSSMHAAVVSLFVLFMFFSLFQLNSLCLFVSLFSDCFSQEERTVLQTAIKRLLSSLSQKQLLDRTQRGVDPPFACMQVLPVKASIGAAKPPKELPMGAPRGPSGLDRGERERQQRQELLQLLKIIARLRLFELPPRANVSWSSGRSQFSLMV